MLTLPFEEANQKLLEGEFENSKSLFASLLDNDPENIHYIAGYFISSYWDNRLDRIFSVKEGKDRGILLDELFEKFENDFSEKKYPKTESFYSVRNCILGESCSQLRLGYQKEGAALDQKIIWTLCRNLVIIRDYKNAIDMIDYCKRKYDMPSEFYYYKAESLFHVGEEKKSRTLFRSTLLHFPESLPIEQIKSEPIASAILELKTKIEKESDLKEYLPVFCMEKDLLPEVPEYTREDVNHFLYEMNRLRESLETDNKDMYFKVKSRILQYGFTIMDTFQGQINSELTRKVRDIISEIDPGCLERRDSNRRMKSRVEEE
ncbi:MAG: hypothetical protein KDK36_21225 [Leptospiraceae bacterium]|nr:hypothetical protein [Leptospiraceae bacterium]